MIDMEQLSVTKAAWGLIYLVSCAVNREKPDAGRCAEMDITGVFGIAKRHSLSAAAAVALEQVMTLPPNFMDAKLRAIRRQSLFDVERAAVLNAFEENGIWYLPLKGIVLKDYYPKTFMREMLDNDILCDASKMQRIREIMESLGYVCKAFGVAHDDEYVKAQMIEFEMHRSLVNEKYYPEWHAYFENVRERAVRDDGNKYGCHMTNEDFYIFLVCHLYKHYVYDGTGLRSLLDIYVFRKRFGGQLNESYLNGEFRKLKIADFEKDIRLLAEKIYTGQELTDEEALELRYFIDSDTMGSFENSVIRRLDNDDSAKAKQKYAIKTMFPPHSSLEKSHPVVYRHKLLYPLWIVSRPFNGVIFKRKKMMYELRQLNKAKTKNCRGKYNK